MIVVIIRTGFYTTVNGPSTLSPLNSSISSPYVYYSLPQLPIPMIISENLSSKIIPPHPKYQIQAPHSLCTTSHASRVFDSTIISSTISHTYWAFHLPSFIPLMSSPLIQCGLHGQHHNYTPGNLSLSLSLGEPTLVKPF